MTEEGIITVDEIEQHLHTDDLSEEDQDQMAQIMSIFLPAIREVSREHAKKIIAETERRHGRGEPVWLDPQGNDGDKLRHLMDSRSEELCH